jgi:hypothetical protein
MSALLPGARFGERPVSGLAKFGMNALLGSVPARQYLSSPMSPPLRRVERISSG